MREDPLEKKRQKLFVIAEPAAITALTREESEIVDSVIRRRIDRPGFRPSVNDEKLIKQDLRRFDVIRQISTFNAKRKLTNIGAGKLEKLKLIIGSHTSYLLKG
mgnify:CR=1 FL=1